MTTTAEILRQLDLVTEPHCRTAKLAAALIREQAAEIERLREAIAPFERVMDSDWDRLLETLGWSGHDRFWRSVIADFNRARDVLADGEKG